jgi:starch synthase (maltosyl-transferring)
VNFATQALGRIVIDDVRPRTPGGWPAKATCGEVVPVSADVFTDGHDLLAARARFRAAGAEGELRTVRLVDVGNDRFEGSLDLGDDLRPGPFEFVVEAWPDHYETWRRDVRVKAGAGQSVAVELEEGALLLESLLPAVAPDARSRVERAVWALRDEQRPLPSRLDAALDDALAASLSGVVLPEWVTTGPPLPLWVDRPAARFTTWYELFPRSERGLQGTRKRLPAIRDMGFDTVYLPPVHPIGTTARKGRDNTLVAGPRDPGSPWAIGGPEGGHTAVHPELGTLDDFDDLVADAAGLGMEIALDYALQCSPDHPWVSEHPEWFHHRPDGSIKHAENPPKKYQDIYPINFWPADDADRVALWTACQDVLEFWIARGIRSFRVDNPHTKPMAFWAWVLPDVKSRHPDVLFLAEAFTRPKVMAKLAEIGFSTSYTYFTWRTTKGELAEYVTELANPPLADYMRPMFWPNTPDILSGPLRNGPPAAFRLRLLLAATLVPGYGMYSGYELCENEPQSDANEEYRHSEKYEVKPRDWGAPGSLVPFVTAVNAIRRAHPALQVLRGTRFHGSSKEEILVYSRVDPSGSDVVLCVVNLDPHGVQEDTLWLDLDALGMPGDEPYQAHDELTGQTFTWSGHAPYVRLDPAETPAHVLSLKRRP